LRRRKDGSIVPVAVTTAPIFLGGNTPLGMIGLAIDISDRIRVLTDLRESEQRFRSVFEHSNDAIFVLDPERNEFLEVNAKAAELLGYPQDELVRLRPSDIHPDEMPQLAAFVEAVFESGHGWTNELTCTTRAGDRLASEISASVISLGGRSWMIATIRDLSAFRRTQDQLSAARDAVRAREAQLDRAAAELSEFARAVSHDLSEPLRTVSSYVQLLDRRYHDRLDQDAAEFIDFTVEAVTRMLDLIKDLLAFARIGAGGREPADVDTAEVVGDVINDLAAAIDSAQATIETADLPVVRGDEIELRALFQNLIANALKFRSPNRSPLIRIESKATADGTEFAVSDNGIGIEPGRQDQVFEVFRRMHSRDEYPGTGIGLAICRKIVTRHGGHLWLESTPDIGTTFFIVLPDGANPSTD
jgi:PAS domain S-box-containing protein